MSYLDDLDSVEPFEPAPRKKTVDPSPKSEGVEPFEPKKKAKRKSLTLEEIIELVREKSATSVLPERFRLFELLSNEEHNFNFQRKKILDFLGVLLENCEVEPK